MMKKLTLPTLAKNLFKVEKIRMLFNSEIFSDHHPAEMKMNDTGENSFHKDIPKSKSDLLLNHWGYDLMGEYTGMLREADFDKNIVVLDVATGTGRAVSILSRLAYRVITGDISLEGRADAENRVTNDYRDMVQYIQLNMEAMPFNSDSMEYIVCMNTLHELENPMQCLEELFRIHTPEGKMFIADFNAEGMDVMDKLHDIRYGEKHPKGSCSLYHLELWAKKHYRSVQELYTRLNRGFLVSGKKTEEEILAADE